MYKSISPLSGQVLATYETCSDSIVESAIDQADSAFMGWSRLSFSDRKSRIIELAYQLRLNKAALCEIMTLEMGKLITEAEAEVEKCAWLCEEYAQHGEDWLAPEKVELNENFAEIHYCPQGVVLAIMPWNFPLWQVIRCAVPTILAGNTVVLKHSSIVPQCAHSIQELFEKSDFPTGCFTNLFMSKKQVSDVISDTRVRGVSLTGSGPAGQIVYEQAAKNLKPAVLELGGSDPYLILKDANVDAAVNACVKGRMLNAGQSCIGAKRFIVHRDVYGEFVSQFRSEMGKYKFGDPSKSATRLGPLASYEHREELHKQVLKSVAQGSHLLIGGYIPIELQGAFYPPTILTEVVEGHLAYSEELFGPVATVIRVDSESEAVRIANDTSFGLGAAIFSEDVERARKMAISDLDTGNVFINEHVKSHPLLPFGGVKISGVGRELAADGIRAFCNKKTVYIHE